MNGFELKPLLAVLGIFVTVGLLLLSALTFRYRVTLTHLQITWLGLPLRRLRLEDIKRIGTRPVLWAERWPNSWDRGRMLVIRRHTGWFRNFVITPNFPFEFLNTLERARKTFEGPPVQPPVVLPASKASGKARTKAA
jgi:hypothetical protein